MLNATRVLDRDDQRATEAAVSGEQGEQVELPAFDQRFDQRCRIEQTLIDGRAELVEEIDALRRDDAGRAFHESGLDESDN